MRQRIAGITRATAGAGLAAGAALPPAGRVLEPHLGSPAPELAALAPLALPVWVVAMLLLLDRRPARLALTAAMAVVLGVQLWWWLPTNQERLARQPAGGGERVVVMTQNARKGDADPGALLREVSRQKVDLLVVTEVTPDLVEALEDGGLNQMLPHHNVHPAPGAAGTGLWSRWPLDLRRKLAGPEYNAPQSVVRTPSGRPLIITGVHVRSPVGGHTGQWRRELALFADDARQVAATPGARLYVGDFNAGSGHAGFRALIGTGLADAADARPVPLPGFTWPAGRAYPPFVRIDHVLVNPAALAVDDVDTFRIPGTDHRGVVASLRLRPDVGEQ